MSAPRGKIEDAEGAIWFQGDNVKEPIGLTDYPSFDIEAVNKDLHGMGTPGGKHHGGFRDNAYRSIMTGDVAKHPPCNRQWTIPWKVTSISPAKIKELRQGQVIERSPLGARRRAVLSPGRQGISHPIFL